jgi:hypothetical protein
MAPKGMKTSRESHGVKPAFLQMIQAGTSTTAMPTRVAMAKKGSRYAR